MASISNRDLGVEVDRKALAEICESLGLEQDETQAKALATLSRYAQMWRILREDMEESEGLPGNTPQTRSHVFCQAKDFTRAKWNLEMGLNANLDHPFVVTLPNDKVVNIRAAETPTRHLVSKAPSVEVMLSSLYYN